MRILLIGKFGQLGWELRRSLYPLGEIVALDYPEIDLSHPETVTNLISTINPTLVINAAAFTDVDQAESQPALADQINAIAPGVIANACLKNHAAFIHYSTDYVFDGVKGTPYIETDAPNPINYYGRSKLAGELAVSQVGGAYLILRTSWVYSLRKGGFVNKVLEWSRNQKLIRIVDDQIGSPTWARLLAESTTFIIAQSLGDPYGYLSQKAGLYHLAGSGAVSRYEWAQEILKNLKGNAASIELIRAKSAEFLTPAKRPPNSSLNCDLFNSTFNLQLPDWRIALGDLMLEII